MARAAREAHPPAVAPKHAEAEGEVTGAQRGVTPLGWHLGEGEGESEGEGQGQASASALAQAQASAGAASARGVLEWQSSEVTSTRSPGR